MLRFHSRMYYGESIKKEHRKLLWRLRHKMRVKRGITLVIFSLNGVDLLDLIPASSLKHAARREQQMSVLGIAGSQEEAIELVQEMVMEVYEATGGTDLRRFYQDGFFEWEGR